MKAKKPDGFIDRSPRGFGLRNGISVPTVYKEIKEGRLSAKKIGSRTYIPPDAEKGWIDRLPDYQVNG